MYTANRRLLQLLVPAFVAQLIIMAVSLTVSLPKLMDSPNCEETIFPIEIIAYRYYSRFNICFAVPPNTGSSICSIVFESFLFGLTLYKYYAARAEGWGSGALLTILVRDGMWAFLLVFGECPRAHRWTPPSSHYVSISRERREYLVLHYSASNAGRAGTAVSARQNISKYSGSQQWQLTLCFSYIDGCWRLWGRWYVRCITSPLTTASSYALYYVGPTPCAQCA